MKIVKSDEFVEMLDKSIIDDINCKINFNDEIISIEEIEEREMIDINVTGNHLYFANGILTHNSATGNSLDIKNVGNDSVSDSLGSIMTADFIMFLLQTEQMKEEKLITCKCTKNRFTGRTDTWNMNIDYEHMRFSDAVIQDGGMTPEEATTEVKTIMQEDLQKIKKHDMKLNDNFGKTKIEPEIDVMAELGLS